MLWNFIQVMYFQNVSFFIPQWARYRCYQLGLIQFLVYRMNLFCIIVALRTYCARNSLARCLFLPQCLAYFSSLWLAFNVTFPLLTDRQFHLWGMINKLRDMFGLNSESEPERRPPKYRYSRPEFLDHCDADLNMSADKEYRPIIVPRCIDRLPGIAGYAE